MRPPGDIVALGVAGALPSLAFLAIGAWVLRGLGVRARGAERWALAFVLGSGTASLALLVLRSLDVPLPPAALAGIALLGIPALRSHRTVRRSAPGWIRAVDAASLVLAALVFASALGPETFWDGFEYHLPIAQAWTSGPVRALPGMLDAELRAAVELLYVPAVSAGQPDAAAAVSAVFVACLAALVRAEATRRASPGAGALAALFVLCVPFTSRYAASTDVDLAVGAYGFVGLLYADRWNRGGDGRALLVSALGLGFAANAKLHAVALWPAALVMLLGGGRRPPWTRLAGWASLTALVALPWYVKAALTTGNPFFPLLGKWLGYGSSSPAILELRRARLRSEFRPSGFSGLVEYLASINFGQRPTISGLLGPLPLALAPLAIQRLPRPTAVLVAVVAVLFGLQYLYMPTLRFGTPFLPFVAVAAAVGGARLARSGRTARRVLGATLAVLALQHCLELTSESIPRVAALRSPRSYERAVFSDQTALRNLVERAPPVVGISKGAVAWMPKPVYNLHWVRNGELFFDRRTRPARALALLRERGVRSLVIQVPYPLPADGRVGHPIVDAWLRTGVASLRSDVPRPPATQRGHVWVSLLLHGSHGAASRGRAEAPKTGGQAPEEGGLEAGRRRPPGPSSRPGRPPQGQPVRLTPR